MDPIRHILVPVDFSATSERAADYAVELAAATGAKLTLAQVIEPSPYLVPADVTDAIRSATKRELDRRAEELRPHARSVETILGEGKPWQEIGKLASQVGADLIVLGTHGRRGFARAILGSVAERVVRSAPVPVVTVPGHAFEDRADAGAKLAAALASEASGPVVLALSRGALPVAEPVARALDGTLDVWLTTPITFQGLTLGAMGEDEQPVADPLPGDRVTAEQRAQAVESARAALREELSAIRGARSPGEVWDRRVLLVAEGLASPAPVIAAARAVRAQKPREIVLAVPVATRAALEGAKPLVDRVVCLEQTVASRDENAWYRSGHAPSESTARGMLGGKAAEVLG